MSGTQSGSSSFIYLAIVLRRSIELDISVMSQLLLRLEQEFQAANEPNRRALVEAQIAGNLARLGRFDEAKKKIAGIRERYGDGRSGYVTVWLMLAEGLVSLYADLSPNAMERIKRAQALSIAMNYSTMTALASAWKAHIEFEKSQFELMNESLKVATHHAGANDHDAQARIAIVVSNAFMYCGDQLEATKWFVRGRSHSVPNGDRASIEALLYNRAAFGLSWLRVLHCKNPLTQIEIQRARSELESTTNLNKLTGIESFSNHLQLWQARLLILESRYDEAMEKLKRVSSGSPFASYNVNVDLINLEICFCRFQVGRRDEAFADYQLINENAIGELDVDEKIVSRWMQWQMSKEDDRFGYPRAHLLVMSQLMSDHTKICLELALSLKWLLAVEA